MANVDDAGSDGMLAEIVCGPDTVMRNVKFTIVGKILPIDETTTGEVENISFTVLSASEAGSGEGNPTTMEQDSDRGFECGADKGEGAGG